MKLALILINKKMLARYQILFQTSTNRTKQLKQFKLFKRQRQRLLTLKNSQILSSQNKKRLFLVTQIKAIKIPYRKIMLKRLLKKKEMLLNLKNQLSYQYKHLLRQEKPLKRQSKYKSQAKLWFNSPNKIKRLQVLQSNYPRSMQKRLLQSSYLLEILAIQSDLPLYSRSIAIQRCSVWLNADHSLPSSLVVQLAIRTLLLS